MIPIGVLASARAEAAGGSVLPSDFAGLSAWYKADEDVLQNNTDPATNGADVYFWNDQSGNDYTLYQFTAGQRPTFYTNVVNGLPAVDFVPTPGNEGRMVSNAPTGGNKQTIFAVVNVTNHRYAQIRGTSGGGAVLAMWLDATGHLCLGPANTATVTSTGTVGTGTWHILTGSVSAAGDFMRARIDGTQTAATYTGTLTGTRGTRISYDSSGVDGFFDGKMAELIAYQSLLSDTDIAAVEGYLATRYGL